MTLLTVIFSLFMHQGWYKPALLHAATVTLYPTANTTTGTVTSPTNVYSDNSTGALISSSNSSETANTFNNTNLGTISDVTVWVKYKTSAAPGNDSYAFDVAPDGATFQSIVAANLINQTTYVTASKSLGALTWAQVGTLAVKCTTTKVGGADGYIVDWDVAYIVVTYTAKTDQTITVGTPAPSTAAYNSQFTVAATASSGLAVSYSSGTPAVCTNSGATFTMVNGTGTCTVQYNQAGDATYNAAPQVTNNVTATKINQTTAVTASAPSSAYYGQTGLSATASGGNGTGTYTYNAGSSTACTVNSSSGAMTITSGTGTCSITATRASDSNYNVSATSSPATVTINKATQATVTVSAPANAYYGQTGLSAAASGGSGTGAYTYDAGSSTACSINASSGALTITSGTGTCSITATRAADTNYNISASSTPATVSITKATPSVTAWPTASAITYGQTLASSTLTGGTATPTGTFAFTTPSTAPNAGTASQSVTFTPADTNYNTANGSVSVTVNKADQVITFNTLPSKTYGDPAFTLAATGGGSANPVTFASSNTAVATVSGTTVTIVSAGITTITASQAGDANYNAAADAFQALTIDKANQTITFTALPGKNIGDPDFAPGASASSTLTVTYSSSDTAVATIVGGMIHIVGAGTTNITASQTGNTNYNAATDVVQALNVSGGSTPTLSVTISGNGSVNSSPSGIACTSGTCTNSTDFTNNQSVDLTASTSWNYDFAGWSGACSGTALTCTVTVNGITEVTATFTAKQLVKVGTDYYASMQDAYNAAVDGAVLQGRNETLTENLDFNRSVNITFNGGNDDTWNVVGFTTVNGTVTLSAGSVDIRNVIVQ